MDRSHSRGLVAIARYAQALHSRHLGSFGGGRPHRARRTNLVRGCRRMIGARRDFADRQAVASALAQDISQRLDKAVSNNGSALIAVSGGTTPRLFFNGLSRKSVAWPRVTVTLVDERCVPGDNERSNARLVKTHLLVNSAAAAKFVPLFNNEAAAAKLGRFDAVVLGMGTDGHTASFFPGGDRLAEALDRSGAARIVAMRTPAAGEPRLTFTLR